jgi:predicted GIY-YIG superfamily endonuclease
MSCDLYRLYNAEDQLLYVGISWSAMSRLAQHKNEKRWWKTVARVDIEHFATRKQALQAESVAIKNEQPVHNIAGRGSFIDGIEVWEAQRSASGRGSRSRRTMPKTFAGKVVINGRVLRVTGMESEDAARQKLVGLLAAHREAAKVGLGQLNPLPLDRWPDNPVFNLDMTAEVLGISKEAARIAVKDGSIPSIYLGGRFLVLKYPLRKAVYPDLEISP